MWRCFTDVSRNLPKRPHESKFGNFLDHRQWTPPLRDCICRRIQEMVGCRMSWLCHWKYRNTSPITLKRPFPLWKSERQVIRWIHPLQRYVYTVNKGGRRKAGANNRLGRAKVKYGVAFSNSETMSAPLGFLGPSDLSQIDDVLFLRLQLADFPILAAYPS